MMDTRSKNYFKKKKGIKQLKKGIIPFEDFMKYLNMPMIGEYAKQMKRWLEESLLFDTCRIVTVYKPRNTGKRQLMEDLKKKYGTSWMNC